MNERGGQMLKDHDGKAAKRSLKDWKPDPDINPEAFTAILPHEIDIKIQKNGNVIVSMDGNLIGMLQQLLLFVDARHPVPVIHLTQAKVVERMLDGMLVGTSLEHDHYTLGQSNISLEEMAKIAMEGEEDDQ